MNEGTERIESSELLSDQRLKFTWREIEQACSVACIDDENPSNLAEALLGIAEKRGVKFKR